MYTNRYIKEQTDTHMYIHKYTKRPTDIDIDMHTINILRDQHIQICILIDIPIDQQIHIQICQYINKYRYD